MLGGVDQIGTALLGELFDERGPTELFNEQGDVDCADVGAQHAGVVRTADEFLGGRVTTGAGGAHLFGDFDRAGDRAECARTGQHRMGDVVRQSAPGVAVGEAFLDSAQVVVQSEGAQVLEQLLLCAVAAVQRPDADAGSCGDRRYRRVGAVLGDNRAGGVQQGAVVPLDLGAPSGLPAALHNRSLLRSEPFRNILAVRSISLRTMRRSVMDEDRDREIRQLVESLQATQSDVEPFLALHTPDTIIVNFGGRRVLGGGDLRRAMEAALASPLAEVTTSAEIDDIRFVRPDVAIVSCTKHVSDQRDTTETLATRGSLTYVAVEDHGEWRVALAQTTPVAGS